MLNRFIIVKHCRRKIQTSCKLRHVKLVKFSASKSRVFQRKMDKLLFLVLATFTIVNCQLGFELSVDDAEFLKAAELVAESEVSLRRTAVLRDLKSLEAATTDYVAIKLKENVLKAVHTLTAGELYTGAQRRSWKKGLGVAKQDEDAAGEGSSSGGGGGEASNTVEEGEEDAATTELTGLGTAVQINQNVFKFLGDTVKILAAGLGGGRGPRVTRKSSDPLFVVSKALMKERYSDQLLGLVVLLANETDSLAYSAAGLSGPLKTVRGSHLNLQQVLVNSVKKAQPVDELLRPESELNTYFFVQTFRQSIDELMLNKLVNRDASVTDLYHGVHGSYELLRAMDKLSAHLKH